MQGAAVQQEHTREQRVPEHERSCFMLQEHGTTMSETKRYIISYPVALARVTALLLTTSRIAIDGRCLAGLQRRPHRRYELLPLLAPLVLLH